MRLKHQKSGDICSSGSFNTSALSEIIVCFDTDMDSDYISNYNVFLKTGPRAGQCIPLRDAFENKDVIVDNYNTQFFEPPTEKDRKRGYTL